MDLLNYCFSYFFSKVKGLIFLLFIISCSPTKFKSSVDSSACTASRNCIRQDSYNEYSSTFNVGSGKIDILFIVDNSASMSFEQRRLAARFSGFIENLDKKKIDYRIAITTTDLFSVLRKRLVTFENGKSYLSNFDANRVSFFNRAIVRDETIQCENFIKGMIYTFPNSWRIENSYLTDYDTFCPSSDERGIYTSSLVINENSDNFIRSDASLNLILVSDEDERSGLIPLEPNDKFESFIDVMNEKYFSKYWEFNSIIVKDSFCAAEQSRQILDLNNQNVVGSTIGVEYAKLSNSPSRDIDNNLQPRGRILNICENDYTQHFTTLATQISDTSRLFNLQCTPREAPTVYSPVNSSVSLYTWNGGTQIVFKKGTEGQSYKINYRCYTGVN